MLILCSHLPHFLCREVSPRCTCLRPYLSHLLKKCCRNVHVGLTSKDTEQAALIGRQTAKVVQRRRLIPTKIGNSRCQPWLIRRPSSCPGERRSNCCAFSTSCAASHDVDSESTVMGRVEQSITMATTSCSINNVLQEVTPAAGRSLTHHEISTTFVTLDRLAYDHLMTMPWAIDDNRVLLCIQASLNSDCKNFFRSIIGCAEFETLKNEARKNCSAFSDRDLVAVVVSMLRLKVDASDEAFVLLLQECQHRCDTSTFDLATLSAYSEAGNYLKRIGFPIIAHLAAVLQRRWNDIPMTLENFNSLSRLLIDVGYFSTNETLWDFQPKLAAAIVHLKKELLPSHVLDVLDPVSRFSEHFLYQFIASCLDILNLRVNEMCPSDLYRALMFLRKLNLRKFGPLVESLHKKIGDRGLVLLNKNGVEKMKAANVVYLLNVFDACEYPHNTQSTMERLMEEHMGDLDVILLKNASFCNMISNNRRLSTLYCQRVNAKLDNLVESISCLISVVHCLANMNNIAKSVDNDLVAYLLHNLSTSQLGMQASHLSTVGRYLIKSLHATMMTTGANESRYGKEATMFTEKLFSFLPRFTVFEMINIARGFSTTTTSDHPMSSSLTRTYRLNRSMRTPRFYVDYVLSRIAIEVLSRRHEILNLGLLNLFVNSVVINMSDSLREGLTQDLVELYDEHTQGILKPLDVKKTFRLLPKLRLRIVDVMERLTNSFLSSLRAPDRNSLTGDVATLLADVSLVTDTLGKLNYRPSKMDQLTVAAEAAVNYELDRQGFIVADQDGRGDVMIILRIVNSLASLDVYPEKTVRRVFGLFYRDRLDDLMIELNLQGKFLTQITLQKLLLQLNRAVILQCPHLHVPWLCENYARKLPNRLQTPLVSKWKQTIQEGLADSLGGLEFVKSGPLFAPYGLVYDFECNFDQSGKPVPHASADDRHLRVAVLLAKPRHFSINDRFPLASLEIRITQLEILCFKVVTISYFELNSMQLSDRQSRKQYFREKLWPK